MTDIGVRQYGGALLIGTGVFGSFVAMAADLPSHALNPDTARATEYIVTELGPPPPPLAGSAMNQGHAVTGVLVGPGHAFLYSRGAVTDLGTLGGPHSSGQGINERRDVAGSSHVFPNDFFTTHAFLYRHGLMKDLGTLGGARSYGLAVNNAGTVAGYSEGADDLDHAFLYYAGAMHDLGALGGPASQAYGINDKGEVTGWAQTRNFQVHAFVYTNGLMADLGTLGGRTSQGRDINNKGQVTGWSEPPGNDAFHRAFLYSDGTMKALVDALESDGFGINDKGEVVGSACDRAPIGCRAFLYSKGRTIDLNTVLDPVTGLGWHVSEARDINNAGWIIANGFNDTLSRSGALLLRPKHRAKLAVDIDIRPTSKSNSINPKKQGILPVAVLGSGEFDATQVDSSTVHFGPGHASPVRDSRVVNMNHDGYPDVLLSFNRQATGIRCGNDTASLSGKTFGGERFEGSDSIRTVGCKQDKREPQRP
jgi:probable HAF family extracellular repeat protein